MISQGVRVTIPGQQLRENTLAGVAVELSPLCAVVQLSIFYEHYSFRGIMFCYVLLCLLALAYSLPSGSVVIGNFWNSRGASF